MTLVMGIGASTHFLPTEKPTAAVVKPAIIQSTPKVSPIKDKSLPVAAPVDPSQALQATLDNWSSAHQDHKWSVVVQGIDDDSRNAAINPNSVYPSASVFKLLLTPRLFSLYSVDGLSNKTVDVDGRGPTNLKTCVDLMVRVSDNPCGIAVGNMLGWSRANASLRQLGLSHTNLNNPNGPTTTAADLVLFLDKFQSGQLYDSTSQDYIDGLMQKQVLRAGIPTGCGRSCTVADKTGDLGYVRHDVAIVSYPGGRYLMAVLTDGASYSQIAQLTAQVQGVMSAR